MLKRMTLSGCTRLDRATTSLIRPLVHRISLDLAPLDRDRSTDKARDRWVVDKGHRDRGQSEEIAQDIRWLDE